MLKNKPVNKSLSIGRLILLVVKPCYKATHIEMKANIIVRNIEILPVHNEIVANLLYEYSSENLLTAILNMNITKLDKNILTIIILTLL
jgi:hypothetical protein